MSVARESGQLSQLGHAKTAARPQSKAKVLLEKTAMHGPRQVGAFAGAIAIIDRLSSASIRELPGASCGERRRAFLHARVHVGFTNRQTGWPVGLPFAFLRPWSFKSRPRYGAYRIVR